MLAILFQNLKLFNMTIIFMTEISPFPVNGGEKLRSYGLLRILSRTFDKVVAIIGKVENKEFKNQNFSNIDFYEFDFEPHQIYKTYKSHLKKFKKDKNIILLFEDILRKYKIDIAYIDYHYYGQYISYFKAKGIPTIYGTHNVQSKITLQRPAVSFKNKFSNLIAYLVYQLHERFYFKKADAVVVVSVTDYNYYKKYITSSKIYVIPNFLVEQDYSHPEFKKKNYVIMTANFFAYQNYAGLQWFVENIWDCQTFKKEKLVLVGMGSDVALKKLKKQQMFDNIEATGGVEDLKPYILQSKVSIVPLLHGSGTRLKCIESMALKTQLLSTSKGAEGIEHDGSIAIADTPENFKKQLKDIIDNKIDYTQKAYDIFIKKYSLEPNYQIFNKIIKNILHN